MKSNGLVQKAAQLRQSLALNPPKPPPTDQGRLLGKIVTDSGEIRFTWMEGRNAPFLRLHFWRADSSGCLWPVKGRCFSIRLRDLPDLAEAVAKACDLANQSQNNRLDWSNL